jgi:hypothetical protein
MNKNMNANKYKIPVIILTLLLMFCFTMAAQPILTPIRPGIQNIVSELKKEKTLHLGAAVGYAGIRETNNKYYKLYKKLKAKATDEELLSLTSDHSKTIVLYSFLVLYSRNYNGLKEVFLKNSKDTSDIWIAGGCTGVVDKVNTFMLRQLNPANMDSRQPYLTQEEYDNYLREFGEIK